MNPNQPSDFRYGVYTRKSSEYEDSQIQSIQRQIDDLSELIDRDGLLIHQEFLRESQSAFHPGREEFGKLVTWTNQGRVNAWLCWHANRLSRNPMDAGAIVYLMDQGKLHHIRTRDRVYYNTPTDKFMLQMEFTMSKKDSDDKSVLVKSGILRRHRRGYPNGYPPPGYALRGQGRSGSSFWVVDSARFSLLRQVFARFLAGKESLTSIQEFAAGIGLTTTKRKSLGGRPVTRSSIHKTVLLNPVYAGFFIGTDGQRYPLDDTLPRVISEEEHTKVRMMLERRNLAPFRTGQREATYRDLIRGPEGGPLGLDFKTQLICDCRKKFSYINRDRCPACERLIDEMEAPTHLFYTYYYSVRDRKSKGRTARVVEEKKIDAFVIREVARKMAISRPLRDWAARYLEDLRDEELRDRKKEARRDEEVKRLYATKRKRLRDLFVSGQVNEEEYRSDMAELEASFKQEEATFGMRDDWFADMEKILDLAVDLENVITHGSPAAKRQALLDLRSNLLWDGKKLSICNAKRVNLLIETLKLAKAENPAFEPEKTIDTSGQNPLFDSVCPTLCRGLDGVRTRFGTLSTGRRKAA